MSSSNTSSRTPGAETGDLPPRLGGLSCCQHALATHNLFTLQWHYLFGKLCVPAQSPCRHRQRLRQQLPQVSGNPQHLWAQTTHWLVVSVLRCCPPQACCSLPASSQCSFKQPTNKHSPLKRSPPCEANFPLLSSHLHPFTFIASISIHQDAPLCPQGPQSCCSSGVIAAACQRAACSLLL